MTTKDTVKTTSFVIGKKVENHFGINILDNPGMAEESKVLRLNPIEQYPVKVLYVKPSYGRNRSKSREANGDSGSTNDENKATLANRSITVSQPSKSYSIKKEFIQNSTVKNAIKLSERPKSSNQAAPMTSKGQEKNKF